MGSFSAIHWIIVAIVALVLFGKGKISETMADFGKGIRSFRQGLSGDDAAGSRPQLEARLQGTPASADGARAPEKADTTE